jgi:DNA-binding protein YbaB
VEGLTRLEINPAALAHQDKDLLADRLVQTTLLTAAVVVVVVLLL